MCRVTKLKTQVHVLLLSYLRLSYLRFRCPRSTSLPHNPSPTTPPGTRRGGPLVGGDPEGGRTTDITNLESKKLQKIDSQFMFVLFFFNKFNCKDGLKNE